MKVSQELLAVPFPEMLKRLGSGIAEAQLQLDLVSVRIAQLMAGYAERPAGEDGGGAPVQPRSDAALLKLPDGQTLSLMELGFTPTFYQFVETVIELKMSISFSSEEEVSRSSGAAAVDANGYALPFAAGGSVRAASVSASFAGKYQYSAEGSAMMRTKLVPVPPPALFEQRARALLEKRRGTPGAP